MFQRYAVIFALSSALTGIVWNCDHEPLNSASRAEIERHWGRIEWAEHEIHGIAPVESVEHAERVIAEISPEREVLREVIQRFPGVAPKKTGQKEPIGRDLSRDFRHTPSNDFIIEAIDDSSSGLGELPKKRK